MTMNVTTDMAMNVNGQDIIAKATAHKHREGSKMARRWLGDDSKMTRSTALRVFFLLLMAVGSVVSETWAANSVYIIINGQGERVTNWQYNGKGIPDKLKSPYATNYRYYESLTDAQADASSNSRTNVITDVNMLVTTDKTYYVRYDYQSYSGSATALDLSGNTWYNIKANTRYMYVNTGDASLPIASTTDGGGIGLNSYKWKLYAVPDKQGNPDPYNIKISNREVDKTHTNYVLTGVKPAGQTELQHANNKEAPLSCQVDGTTENAGMSFQRFILTQVSGKTTWQLIAAYEYPEKDGSPQYYNGLGDHSQQHHYIHDGNPVSASRVWNCQHGNDDSQLAITESTATTTTFHLINLGTDGAGTSGRREVISYQVLNNGTLTASLRADLRSPLVSGFQYYGASAVSTDGSGNYTIDTSSSDKWTEGATLNSEVEDVYVTYTYDASTAALKLDGSRATLIKNQSRHLRARDNISGNGGGGGDRTDYNAGIGDATLKSDLHYQWLLKGNDPYNVRLYSYYYETDTYGYYLCRKGDVYTFIVKDGNSFTTEVDHYALMPTTADTNDNGDYELMAIQPDGAAYIDGNYRYLRFSSDYPRHDTKASAAVVQTDLQQLAPPVTYHIVNLGDNGQGTSNRKEVISVISTTGTVSLPATLRSPLATNFRYYRAEAFASTSGTSAFLNPSNTYELTEDTDVPAGVTDIYVTYEYNAATAAVKLDKVSQYNIRINSALYCVDRKNNSNAALTGDMDTDWSTYAWDESTLTSNGYTLAEQNGRWLLAGNDPYNIKIYSVKDQKYHLSMYNSEPYARLFREGQTSQTLDITSFAIFANSTGGYEMLALKPDGTPYGNGTNYYLGANNNNLVRLSNFTDAARKMEFLPFVTYAIVRQGTTDAPVETVVVSYVADQTLSLPNRTKFQRVGCTLSTKYYRDRACTQEITSMSADATTVYIPYTFNSTDAERTALANTGMVFSTESDPVWLNLIVNNRFETYDSSGNQLRTDNGGNLNKVSDYDYVNPAAQFAFIGDPYAFKVYSRSSSKYAYLDGTANETTVSGTVRFADAPSDELSTWAIIPGYNSNTTFQVMLNGHSNMPTRAFWNPSGGGTPIVMWTVEGKSDNNAWVAPIRNLDYQWCIVNKQNSLLSKLTSKSDAATTLWSTFPDVLKSPMIADSESKYKFFNTQAEAYAYTTDGTATGAITTWGDVTGTDIYVGYRYDPDSAPAGSLDLTGGTWYLVYYNKSESTQCYAIRSFDNSTGNLHNYYHWRSNASPQTKLDKIDCFLWKLTGDDPYGFQMTNKSSNSTLRFNKTATSWNSDSWYTGDGNDRFFLHKDASGNWNIGQVSPNYNTGERNYIRWLGTNAKDNDSNNLQLQSNDTNANNIYESDRAYQDLTIETFKLNYTYNIVDNEGRIAIKYTERQEVGQTLGYGTIPEAIRSPYIEDEALTFYDTFTENDLSTLAGLLTVTPSVPDANIYVRYTTDRLSAKPLHLTGSRSFKMQVNGDYINNNGGSFTHQNTDPGDQTSSFLWNVLGNDPYAVKVRNVGDNTKFFTYNTTTPALTLAADGDDTRFILMRHTSATNPAETELMAATGADLAVANYYSVGRTTGDNDVSVFANTQYEHGYDQLTVLLTPVVLDITYRVIDKQNKIVLEVPADNPELGLPAEWKSPLVAADGYHYWAESNFTKTGNTYTLREAQTEISSTSASTDGYIYVTYDVITDADDANYVDLNPDVTDYKERVRRVANDTSTPMVRNAANFGTMYMLEFLNGVPDYLENGGDEVETFTTKPVYPYNNGDGQMYIYGSDRWNTQSTAGASTRTRWPWYLLAVNNDPYHVMVTSWQNTHARAENGTTTNYYGFLRTYYNTTINQVITTTVSDDPKETTDATHGDPSAVPTEYMLLGQKDAYKLMTTEEVNGSHQTVNSFEQYWKTYETVTKKNEYTLPDMNPGLNHALTAGTLHCYGAWVNARPDIGGGNRAFEYRDHWYQTISMGNGTFKLNPTEIDAVLVLTDNHGWEVMRHPIAKYSENTKYEQVKQFLRKYDSPMVSQYHFYATRNVTHKVAGYHKYNIHYNSTITDGTVLRANDHVGTGASLADYPQKFSGGALYDLYVTYDVKPEYADAYTGGATTGTVNYPFLIRQNGKLAKTENGTTITFDDATTTIDANNVSSLSESDHPELYWYLKPNFDIDREMGYLYDVKDADDNVISEAATNTAYNADGRSGFDPYNIQIYNDKYPSAYFTTNATAAQMENHQYMVTTAPAGEGTLSLGGTPSEQFAATIADYDSKTLHITNATFMAVEDANGNMRLMPRFDHSRVISNFGTLVTPAAAQPVDDKEHSQTTWLLRPEVYTYVIVDNEGREALRYQTVSTGAPSIPSQFRSPLATNFKYYKEITLENEITKSYNETTGINNKTVYVHYDYNREADTQGLLQGTWLTTQLNGTDVQYNGGITTGTKNAANAAWQWRLLHSSGDTPDPYAVTFYTNADGLTNPMGTSTLAGGTVTASGSETYPRFVLLSHKGTANAYALAVAGTASASDFYFLNGSSWPATTALESGYANAANLSSALSSDATKLTFTADITPTNIRYKIVTLSGQIALTGDSLALASGKPSMPYYMRSPLMSLAEDTYSYYAGVTESDGKYTAVNPTTTLNNLDVEDGKSVVYVRYDYDKSRKAVTYFGGLVNNYITDAPLDLSGQVNYVLSLGGGHIWQKVDTSTDQVTLRSNGDDIYRNNDRWRKRSLWLLKGNDPYEVQFVNPEYSSTKVFASQEASTANTITDPDMTHRIATKMVEPDDTDYPYQTFMILKGANNYDPLKLFVTGHDDMFISESGSLYAWKDRLNYKARTDEKSEPTSRGSGQYIRFGYRPNIVFHVITNDGQEAVWANSVRASEYNKTEFRLPEYVQSPLLTATDYRYYTKATWDGSKWTVDESSLVPSTITTAAQAAAERIGEVWVRYTYDPETSPYMIASDIDDSNEMRVDFTNAKGLDLSGNTWYNMSAMQSDWGTKHGKVLGFDSGNKMQQQDVSTAKHGVSDKKFLWRMEGNDPYAIRLVNASEIDKCLSINSGNNIEMATYGTSGLRFQTFMLLNAVGTDNEEGDFKDGYPLRRWSALFGTGTEYASSTYSGGNLQIFGMIPLAYTTPSATTSTNYPNGLSATNIRMTGDDGDESKQNFPALMFNGIGSTAFYCLEFTKAPVSRKYHYHAYNTEKREWTWDVILEHDFLAPLVLEDQIARLYSKYEQEYLTSGATTAGIFKTRTELEALNNAQFYSNEAMTERVYDSNSGNYDIYPEINEDAVYDIYFKYQPDTEAEVSGRKLGDITSTEEQVQADVDYREAHGKLDERHLKNDTHANWFFMVLDTDADITTTTSGSTRVKTGSQHFLRREDGGGIGCMHNSYTLHKETADNYNNWTYNRLAECYRQGENDAFREGRWLWTFVGDDPYRLRLLNMESAVGVTPEGEGVYKLTPADNCWTTVSEETTEVNHVTTTTYPVSIPTAEPAGNDMWGLVGGYSGEATIGLLSTVMTKKVDNIDVNQLLYWQMQGDSVACTTRATDRSQAIQLLPYEPVKYEDVQIIIRRKDEVDQFKTGTKNLDEMTTGISKLYFAAHERKYVEGDKIDLTDEKNTLPFNIRRAFCEYTLYRSESAFDEVGNNYIVKAGPYPDYTKPLKNGDDNVYDEDGHQIYRYFKVDPATGNLTDEEVTTGAQAIYAHYVVKSDIFLASAPTQTEVTAMANSNDHVYFMDFPDPTSNATHHHAYYDPDTKFFDRTGNLKSKIDSKLGRAKSEKKKWDGTQFVDDTDLWYNNYQYRSASNRMVSTPERLKWYFVGDPYKVQVYSVAGDWGSNNDTSSPQTVAANLARFDETETNFQFVVDCVHLRVPDYSIIDERKEVSRTDMYGNPLEDIPNRHYNQPYFDDFYWECVPAASSEEGTFALRFKEDNDLLGYRNVYYYLAHDGLQKGYITDGKTTNYDVNLSYNPNNETHGSGDYPDYHKANDRNTIIRLVQPAKVYVTAKKNGTAVVTDELSEYFGVGETLTEVPRHLQRKFVSYEWTNQTLTLANASNVPLADCSKSTHTTGTVRDLMPSESRVAKEKVDPVYKFDVSYTVDDKRLDNDGNEVHLFTTYISSPQWVDMWVSPNNWLFYDKNQTDKTQVSSYRTAVQDNSADGWNDGLKGLHWALVGDPYDFTILNRRRYEDGNNSEAQWLAVSKVSPAPKDIEGRDSVIWTTKMMTETDNATISTDIAAAATATHFSTQMWKLSPRNNDGTYQTGNADGHYFLRTASLKTTIDDYNNASPSPYINQTNNYWRMVCKPYPNGNTTKTSYFEMVPYSLTEKSDYNGTQYGELFSSTMSGLGVVQQRMEIRTAVAKDEDDANNNCFDADVEIRTATGVLRLRQDNMEIRYGDAIESLPVSLRRYGCNYTCYINYQSPSEPGTPLTKFLESNSSLGDNVTLTYVYTVNDDVAPYFTTAQDAKTDDYTWMNTYFQWEQTYSGTSVEVERTRRKFDHYVYNSAGQITGEVWIEEPYIEIVNNPTEAYTTKGYLNTHTGQTPVYGDETTQSEDDRQKWSLVGDPYSFEMKNYAQYLTNPEATVALDGQNLVTQGYGAQQLAIAIGKDGKPFMAVINPDGTIKSLVDFEFASTSDKSLYSADNTGVNTKDATGNTLNTIYKRNGATMTVKPFYLANLIKYADILVYHLVMAHQYSLGTGTSEAADDAGSWTDDQKKGYDTNGSPTGVYSRLLEFLQYRDKKDGTSYSSGVTIDNLSGNAYTTLGTNWSNVRTLLKQKGTLRNFLSYPVVDQEVDRVGIGNRPQVPWYMKRQFCQYTMYQRDVLRSKPDPDNPVVVTIDGKDYNVWANDVEGKVDTLLVGETKPSPWYKACNITWVSIFDKTHWTEWTDAGGVEGTDYETVGDVKLKIPSGYAEALGLQGQVLEKLLDCHHNRKVIIDVVYDVNPNEFQFAQKGRNTTAWYQMMTNNAADGLMNFTYKDGIGARLDRTHHYTNNYLWAPEGDPYGFVLRSRYATINGTGWDDVAVTTKGKLPKGEDASGNPIYKATDSEAGVAFTEPTDDEKLATYTSRASSSGGIPFSHKRIIHRRSDQDDATTDGATNAVYEMFVGGYDGSFLMHPTAAWMDNDDADHQSYYMKHFTTVNTTSLTKSSSKTLLADPDANWRLAVTAEQLIPYFNRSGYVGGLDPTKAQTFTNTDYYSQLQQSIANNTALDFATLRKIQELVYSGTFYKSDGTTVVNPEDDRPTGTDLPMKFVAENLVNMKPGYYRIEAFSEEALNTDGNDLSGTGVKGIVGPRFISGYRFESEKTDPNDATNNGDANTKGRWLHFHETDMSHSTIHTYADLKAKIQALHDAGHTERDVFNHTAMDGNIEILPADFDPSSIFQFSEATSDTYKRYTISTQGLELHARPGGTEGNASPFGKTELNEAGSTLATGFDDKFRLEDIGGAATTIRVRQYELGGTKDGKTLSGWDDIVAENLKTNYVCIDRNHRYRITCHTDNEMVEIGDHYTTDGLNGIQDTKWLLKPVGIREQWPYNEMPLRLEVHQGGVKNQELSEVQGLKDASNKDTYYYGSLYVPFDTRLANTTDAAFTLTSTPTAATTTVTMQSVSQLNNMGNPQYVPAEWPVIIRTGNAKSITLLNQDASGYATRYYVNMYLPNDAPVTDAALTANRATITLGGKYLEQSITTSDRVMVFGLPFEAHNETHDDANTAHHEYNQYKHVGWYRNDNWNREDFSGFKAHEDSYPSSATVATDGERSNTYIYHNKVYLLTSQAAAVSPAPSRHIIALFDGEGPNDDEPYFGDVTDDVPWPCDVYDLQGRKVAANETPATLLYNHPGLAKGVYIFGGRKVIVK